jgi:predicted nucleotide-binding protein
MHQDQAMKVIQGQLPVSMKVKERLDRLFESFPKEIPTTVLSEKDQVFIVHGRDDSSKKVVYQFLTDLGLEPIILHEQTNKGRTIIEKFEDHSSNVKYAVVLLTPDDLGGLAAEPNKTLPRARQNVVFEMGYFFGRFGRERVCALLSSEVERPSDIDGIMYIQLSQNEEWKSSLFRELKDAGLNIGNFE